MRPPVSIIILTWNAVEETERCFRTLWRTLGPDDEVIIVDNGSTDGTHKFLKENMTLLSKVHYNKKNMGFSKGCNQGAALATHDILIFLNNDTMLAMGWIEELVKAFELAPNIAAAGPSSNCVAGPQRINTPKPDYVLLTNSLDNIFGEVKARNRRSLHPTKNLVGFCLAIRKEAFEEVDGFDEQFKVGSYEDRDLCMRLVNNGWKLIHVKDCWVWHKCHATFRANGIVLRENQKAHEEIFKRKWDAT